MTGVYLTALWAMYIVGLMAAGRETLAWFASGPQPHWALVGYRAGAALAVIAVVAQPARWAGHPDRWLLVALAVVCVWRGSRTLRRLEVRAEHAIGRHIHRLFHRRTSGTR